MVRKFVKMRFWNFTPPPPAPSPPPPRRSQKLLGQMIKIKNSPNCLKWRENLSKWDFGISPHPLQPPPLPPEELPKIVGTNNKNRKSKLPEMAKFFVKVRFWILYPTLPLGPPNNLWQILKCSKMLEMATKFIKMRFCNFYNLTPPQPVPPEEPPKIIGTNHKIQKCSKLCQENLSK